MKRVHLVASVLGYDYFKLWEIPEYEFNILYDMAQEELDNRKKRLAELQDNNNK